MNSGVLSCQRPHHSPLPRQHKWHHQLQTLKAGATSSGKTRHTQGFCLPGCGDMRKTGKRKAYDVKKSRGHFLVVVGSQPIFHVLEGTSENASACSCPRSGTWGTPFSFTVKVSEFCWVSPAASQGVYSQKALELDTVAQEVGTLSGI